MRDVAIIGAGELGGSLAHVLARRDIVAGIRLVDEKGRVAEGKALDIAQAAPVESFATRLLGSTDLMAAAGAAIVVMADGVGGSEWDGEDGLRLLHRIVQLAGHAVIVCAGARQRELVERGVRELRIGRRRLFGSAPEAYVAAARAIVALEAHASPRDVTLSVLGNPPAQFVLPWEEATIGGFTATRVLDEPARRRVNARLPALWPPGPYALATAATKVIESIAGGARRIACCFVAQEDTGTRTRTAALPVALGPSGIREIVLPQLNARDRVILDNAMMLG